MNAPAAVHGALRAVDPELASRQTRLIGAFNHRIAGELHIVARLAVERDWRAASVWIRFRTRAAPVSVAPLLVDGQLARLTIAGRVPDAAAAAAALARIEPVLAGLERALGDELHPEEVDTMPPSGTILIRVDAGHGSGPIDHRLIVAMPSASELTGLPLALAVPDVLRRLRVRWSARIHGPMMRMTRLATIAVGDMLLLGARTLAAHMSLPGHKRAIAAVIDVRGGLIMVQDDVADIVGSADAPPDMATTDWEMVRVATVIEIDGGMLSATEAAALGGGSVLPLPGGGGTLAVRVRAGETVIGTGELVALGDGFGVIFTSVATQREPG